VRFSAFPINVVRGTDLSTGELEDLNCVTVLIPH
jgi:hypothetical protein